MVDVTSDGLPLDMGLLFATADAAILKNGLEVPPFAGGITNITINGTGTVATVQLALPPSFGGGVLTLTIQGQDLAIAPAGLNPEIPTEERLLGSVQNVEFSGPGFSAVNFDNFELSELQFDRLRGLLENNTPEAWNAFLNSLEYDIRGTSADDVLIGQDQNDEIRAFAGNDFIEANNGDDLVWGFAGDDFAELGQGDDTMLAGSGDDAVFAGDGDDSVNGVTGDDFIFGGIGADSIDGAAGNDFVSGGFDQDTIVGGFGDDVIFGDTENDKLSGDDGDDVVSGGLGADLIDGGTGEDLLFGDGSNDTITGGNQDDTIEGNSGDDSLLGNAGDDVISGDENGTPAPAAPAPLTEQAETIQPIEEFKAGSDTLDGGFGDDLLKGNGNADFLFGRFGEDTLIGGEGSDIINGGNDSAAGAPFENDVLWGDTFEDPNEDALDDLLVEIFVGSNGDPEDGFAGVPLNQIQFPGDLSDPIDPGRFPEQLNGDEGIALLKETLNGNSLYRIDNGTTQDKTYTLTSTDTDFPNPISVSVPAGTSVVFNAGTPNAVGNTVWTLDDGHGLNKTATDNPNRHTEEAEISIDGYADTFAFTPNTPGVGFGFDTIEDFQFGLDTIVVGGYERGDIQNIAQSGPDSEGLEDVTITFNNATFGLSEIELDDVVANQFNEFIDVVFI